MPSTKFTAKCLILAVITALLVGFTGGQVLSGPPERVKVIISFSSPPGMAEETQIKGVGGEVRYRYQLINGIAATLPETAIPHLLNNPKITLVEPDTPMHAIDIELDNAWGVKHISAGDVHTDYNNRGEGVNIAIIDSGIKYNHPDLDDNYVTGADFVEWDDDPWDVYGHGTHVAGIACAEDNDSSVVEGLYGVVGVAPMCNLYALKVLDDNGWGYASDLVYALQWALTNEIHIANLSLGWDRYPGEAVEQAFLNAEQNGLVIVAAACNNGKWNGRGENVCYPGKFSSVIAVAATDSEDIRASFSSTGLEVELAAPGVSVLSTWNGNTSYSTPIPVCYDEEELEDQTCYKLGSGTSMASPHVAGVAALIIAAGIQDNNNNGKINDEVRQRLIATAEDLGKTGWDAWYGYGLVNAYKAVEQVEPPEPVVDIAITGIQGPSSVTQGEIANIALDIENVGTEDVNNNEITGMLYDTTIEQTIGSFSLDGIAAGESVKVEFTWDTSMASIGDHSLTGIHYFADDNTDNNSISLLVTVNELAPTALSILSVYPNVIRANSQTEVTISGTGFRQDTVISFEGGKGVSPVGTAIDGNSEGTLLLCNVVTKWTPKPTTWNVKVTNPDGQTDVLLNGLTIQP